VAQGAACGALPHFATRLLLTFAFYSLFYSPLEETGNGGRPHCLPRLSKAARR
jgi:hypothetical protein